MREIVLLARGATVPLRVGFFRRPRRGLFVAAPAITMVLVLVLLWYGNLDFGTFALNHGVDLRWWLVYTGG